MGEAHRQRTCIGMDIPSSQYKELDGLLVSPITVCDLGFDGH
jgi:hypothetical protein